MYRLYKKNVLNFSLVWMIAYVVLLSFAENLSASLGLKKIITAPVCIVFVLLIFTICLCCSKHPKDQYHHLHSVMCYFSRICIMDMEKG